MLSLFDCEIKVVPEGVDCANAVSNTPRLRLVPVPLSLSPALYPSPKTTGLLNIKSLLLASVPATPKISSTVETAALSDVSLIAVVGGV